VFLRHLMKRAELSSPFSKWLVQRRF